MNIFNSNQNDNKSFRKEELEKLFPDVDFSKLNEPAPPPPVEPQSPPQTPAQQPPTEPEYQVAFEPAPVQAEPPKVVEIHESKPTEIKPPIQPEKLQKKPKSGLKVYLKFAALFAAIFIVTFLAVNFSALSKVFQYFANVNLQRKAYSRALPTPTPAPVLDPTSEAKLIIPKIGVSAPIIWNIPEDQMQKNLVNGVVHYQGTALPGQKGNIFITGHSSYYSWSTSPYKDVFALLEKMSPGDNIYIQYKGTSFVYQVSSTKVVSPKDTSVLNQGTNYNLTLMTCVPVGTNLNRLIVSATQVTN